MIEAHVRNSRQVSQAFIPVWSKLLQLYSPKFTLNWDLASFSYRENYY